MDCLGLSLYRGVFFNKASVSLRLCSVTRDRIRAVSCLGAIYAVRAHFNGRREMGTTSSVRAPHWAIWHLSSTRTAIAATATLAATYPDSPSKSGRPMPT